MPQWRDNAIEKISPHVYWLPPGEPDRPSLCAVVGSDRTVLLDAGASAAHARLLLDPLAERGLPPPSFILLSHWHWDHVFATGEIDAPVIAHELTAKELDHLASLAWDDDSLAARAEAGFMRFSTDHIKEELPAPRTVRIAPAAITFADSLTVHLGGVTCQIHHVGGDHAADSSVIYVLPDKVLFLSDCLYDAVYAPVRHYTPGNLLPLIERLSAFDAEYVIEGHMNAITKRAEFRRFLDLMRAAVSLVTTHGADESAVFAAARAQIGELDDDSEYILRALMAGVNA